MKINSTNADISYNLFHQLSEESFFSFWLMAIFRSSKEFQKIART